MTSHAKLCGFFGILVLAFAGCSSERNAAIFHPWGWDNIHDAKAYLDAYRHVLVARVDESSWEDLGPHRLTPYRFKGTVIKTYKGDWSIAEKIACVHYVDAPAPAPSVTNACNGDLVFIFTNAHTNSEIGLYTGEWGDYNDKSAPALDKVYGRQAKNH